MIRTRTTGTRQPGRQGTGRRTAHRGVAVLLSLLAVLPVTAAAADPVPGAAGPAGELVPGVPLGPGRQWQPDTPDQVLPPRVYQPSAAEDAVEPRDAAAEADALIEYVPPSEAVAGPAVSCSRYTGPHQRRVEKWLRLTSDGRQSARDCRAIRAFQAQHGIMPAIGFAGPVTWARMQLLTARKNPNAAGQCPVRSYEVACVDLSRQLMWVQRGTTVLFGPVPIRSGRADYPTRTGWHEIYWKHKNHVSTLYDIPMPYAQFFDGGQAFHGTYGSVYAQVGSMGCVNLRIDDARTLWQVLDTGDSVYVWGQRPGA